MKRIVAYLLLLTAIDITLVVLTTSGALPDWVEKVRLIVLCSLVGGIGGAVYCLRGVYLNACVRKSWDEEWHLWYYIRPVVSHLCGAISYLFLKAGLLLLEAKQASDTTHLGFLALAFIAGLNVDKFITKIEDVAQTTWGIKKSRTASEEGKDGN